MAARIPITDAILNQLTIERWRTNTAETLLLRHANNVPDDLNAAKIECWRNGRIKSAKQSHIEYVFSEYGKLETIRPPTQDMLRKDYKPPPRQSSRMPRVILSDTDISALKKQRMRTGISAYSLLNGAKNPPTGLTSNIVLTWLNGKVQTVREDYLDYVLGQWQSLPDAPADIKPDQVAKQKRHKKPQIPADTLRKLKAERDRTGLSGYGLLTGRADKPEGLSEAMVSAWLIGRIKAASQEHLKYVLICYSEADDYVEIPDALIARLHTTKQRYNCSWKNLFDLFSDPPKSLNPLKIMRFASKADRKAAKSLVLYLETSCDVLLEALD